MNKKQACSQTLNTMNAVACSAAAYTYVHTFIHVYNAILYIHWVYITYA